MLRQGLEFSPGYRLETFLGRGQFGEVWRIEAPGGTQLAVKFINLSNGQWEKEYRAIKRVMPVRHPNLMPIVSMWLLGEDGKALLASERSEPVAFDTMQIDPQDTPQTPFKEARRGAAGNGPEKPSIETTQWLPQKKEVDWLEQHGGVVKGRWLAVSMVLGGKSLQDRLVECRQEGLVGIPEKELLRLIEEAAKGIDYLNTAPELHLTDATLQHCDVKPANIVLIGDSAVVCDFGLAQTLQSDEATQTSLAGTIAYMSPETSRGKPSRNSDQYSLAVTYYHLRTGELPFAGATGFEILRCHQEGKLQFDGVGPAEQQVLRKATSLRWQARFHSNLEMTEALREALRGHAHPGESLERGGLNAKSVSWRKPLVFAATLLGCILAFFVWKTATTSTEKEGGGRQSVKNGDLELAETQPLDDQAWDTLLESASVNPESVAPQFKTLAEQFDGVLYPLSFQLSGHDRDIERLVWLPATQSNAERRTILISQALDPNIIAFDLTKVRELVASRNPTRRDNGNRQEIYSLDLEAPSSIVAQHTPFASALHLSSNARWGASGDLERRVLVWSAASEEPFLRASLNIGDVDIGAVLWHPSGEYLLIADGSRKLSIVESVSGWPPDVLPAIKSVTLDNIVRQWHFNRSGEKLIYLDGNYQLKLLRWEDLLRSVSSNEPPQVEELSSAGAEIREFTILSDESQATSEVLIASSQFGELLFFSLLSGHLDDRFEVISHGPVISFSAVTDAGKTTAVCGGEQGQLTLLRNRERQTLAGHDDVVSAVAISPDGHWAAAVSRDRRLTLRSVSDDPSQFATFYSLNKGSPTTVSWDPTGRWLITGDESGGITLWDARHLRLLTECFPESAERSPPAPSIPASPILSPDLDSKSRT